MVDGVQADSIGSDETSNSLQLTMSHIVLEKNVIWEVHTADWLQRSRCLAADWDATVLGVILDSQGLGHRALVELHLGHNVTFFHLLSCWKASQIQQQTQNASVRCSSSFEKKKKTLSRFSQKSLSLLQKDQAVPLSVALLLFSVLLCINRSLCGSLYTLCLAILGPDTSHIWWPLLEDE